MSPHAQDIRVASVIQLERLCPLPGEQTETRIGHRLVAFCISQEG